MISSEVKRTLVKSPPELWTELSDPAALARHLGELGEIRITRVEPERTVEWESEDARGTVLLKPSGWGTKVTLSVTSELPARSAAPDSPAEAVEAAPEPEPSDVPETPQATAEPNPEEAAPAIEEPETPQATAEPNPEEAAPAIEEPETLRATAEPHPEEAAPAIDEPLMPRRGFFSRLWRRQRRPSESRRQSAGGVGVAETPPSPGDREGASVEPARPDSPEPRPRMPAIEALQARYLVRPAEQASAPAPLPSIAVEAPVPEQEAGTEAGVEEEPSDISAELEAAEAAAAARVTAVLTATLDRLGAAHHRPFSRS